MKKVIVGTLAAALVLTFGIASVSAAGMGNRGSFARVYAGSVCGYAGSNYCYNDVDQDGICDNYDTYSRSGGRYSHNRDHSGSYGNGSFGQGAGHHGGTHHR